MESVFRFVFHNHFDYSNIVRISSPIGSFQISHQPVSGLGDVEKLVGVIIGRIKTVRDVQRSVSESC